MKISCNRTRVEKYVKDCGVGISARTVPNDRITSTGYIQQIKSNHYQGANGRLFTAIGNGAWANDNWKGGNQWIQIDLEVNTTIHGIATQGMERGSASKRWVTMYHVAYQYEGSSEFLYVEDSSGNRIRFLGNHDNLTPHVNRFPEKITAQIFRVYPLRWYTYIALRLELFKC